MPKLWDETIEAHRQSVRDAILDTTADLVTKHGLASVTMSQIAEDAGVGRATLYKYFRDVDAILVAWHERHVERHLTYLVEVRDRSGDAREQLEAVLEAYALIPYRRFHEHGDEGRHREHHARGRRPEHSHRSDIAGLVHRTEHVADGERRLAAFFRDLIANAARRGFVRSDVPPEELARFCVRALAAAGDVDSKPAVRRLVGVTLAGLRPARN